MAQQEALQKHKEEIKKAKEILSKNATTPAQHLLKAELGNVNELLKMIEETEAKLLAAQNMSPEERERRKMVQHTLIGDLNLEHRAISKVVRIFTSSTFTGQFIKKYLLYTECCFSMFGYLEFLYMLKIECGMLWFLKCATYYWKIRTC